MRFKIYMLLFCFFCSSVNGQNPVYNIQHSSLTRSYILHLPVGFTANDTLPLVFCFHGLNQTPGRIAQVSGFDTIADREHFIVVYPLGVDTVWNTFSSPYHSGTDDIGFVSALIDTLNRDYHINLNRVYATGMSNGGFLSYKLACELSNRIAAIAPLAGAFTDSMKYYCNPQRPMPVLDIHGTSDFIVGYNGGFVNISTAATLDYWVQYEHCSTPEANSSLPNTNTQDNSTVTRLEWKPCDAQTEVVHYKVTGGGHTWPGSSVDFGGLGGNVNRDIDASEVIWEFFNKHSLQGQINAVEDIMDAMSLDIFPNPADDELNIVLDGEVEELQLIDLCGRTLINRNTAQEFGRLQLSLASYPSGIYLIHWNSNGWRGVLKVLKL